MIAALDASVSQLAHASREVVDKLQPGLSLQEIATWEAKLPFALTRELEALYQWHDGTLVNEGDLLGQAYFFPGYYLLSLEEAVESHDERKDAWPWEKNWFPVFASGAGDFYVVPCSKEKLDTAVVIGVLHGEPEQVVEYQSLTAMMKTLEACHARGAFVLDDGELEVDDDKHRVIARHFNPEVEEWQD